MQTKNSLFYKTHTFVGRIVNKFIYQSSPWLIFGISFFALLFLLFSLSPFPSTTYAQEEESLVAGTAPVPLEGDEDVVFVSQSVDATVSRSPDGQYWVDAQGAVRLHNTNPLTPTYLKFGWPGWPGDNLRFDLIELADFKPVKDGKPLTTTIESRPTTWAAEEKESRWVISEITIEPDKRDRIYFDWRQPLANESLLTYSFALKPAQAWSGSVGSTRITLNFPQFTSPESIVAATPLNYTFTGDKIEWLIIDQEPQINPTVIFIAPHLWQEIEQARADRATEPVQANLRLVGLYEQLLQLGITKYEGEIEGALNAAHQAGPDEVEPLQRLAALYQAQAAQEPNNLALLEQAVTTTEALLATGADDEDSRKGLVRDLLRLAALWAENDAKIALDFLNRAEAAGADPTEIERERAIVEEKLISAAVERGELEHAFDLAQEYGLTTELPTVPWLTSSEVHLKNEPDKRLIFFTAYGEHEALDQKLRPLADHIEQMGYLSTWDTETSTLTIQFDGNNQSWLQSGNDVASFLRDEPELELLRAALSTNPIQYRLYEDQFYRYYEYREQLNIDNLAQKTADQIRQEAAASPVAQKSAWHHYLLSQSAIAWQQLADSQRFGLTTQFYIQGNLIEREWRFTIPSNETIEWSGHAPRYDRWFLLAIIAAGGLFLLLGLIWLPGAGR